MPNRKKSARTKADISTNVDINSITQTIANALVGGSFVKTGDKEKFLKQEFKHMRSVFEDNYNEYEKVMLKDIAACKNCGTLYWDGCKKRCDCQ